MSKAVDQTLVICPYLVMGGAYSGGYDVEVGLTVARL